MASAHMVYPKFSGFPKYLLLLAALPHLLDAQTTVTLSTSPNPSIFVAQNVNASPVSSFATGTPLPFANVAFVADFNGDGKADIAAGYSPARVLLGDGKGNFQSTFTSGLDYLVAVGDFNGDGRA